MNSLSQSEIEGASFPGRGFDPDPSTVTLDDLLHDGQPEAGPSAVLVPGMEALEDPEDGLQVLLADSDAVVPNIEDKFAVLVAFFLPFRGRASGARPPLVSDLDQLLRFVVVLGGV